MLTGRPDVPRTPFGRLKPQNGVFGGDTRPRIQFKGQFFWGLYDTLIHKNNLFLRLEVTFNC